MKLQSALLISMVLCTGDVQSAPVKYVMDPDHTFPSFEADHMGISVWRGKFNKSKGEVLLDKTAGTAAVQVTIDLSSVDFGHEKLNAWAISADFFNVEKNPEATFRGMLKTLPQSSGVPLVGQFTLNGVTRPLTLQVKSLKCIEHPIVKRDYCGADAYGVFQRDQFGLDAGKAYGFNMDVMLRIQVEALREE